MTANELRNKRITLATLKSFIRNAKHQLFVEQHSNFNGMTDMVESVDREIFPVEKEDAIGHKGVWCVGSSSNSFKFAEKEGYHGITVWNCCGSGTLWTRNEPAN